MAEDLESFLQTEYPAATKTIADLASLSEDVVSVFASNFLKSHNTWPYQLVNNEEPTPPTSYTFSTTAMIVFALSLAMSRVRDSSLAPAAARQALFPDTDRAKKLRQQVPNLLEAALDTLVRQSSKLQARRTKHTNPEPLWDPPITKSATFGWDDPFTLTWLLEVLWDDPDVKRQAFREVLMKRAWKLVKRVLDQQQDNPLRAVLQINEDERVLHSFPLLRVLQLGDTLSRRERSDRLSRTEDLSRVRELLFERIHLHLSESRIPEGGFDAADLVFSLEGWILSTPVEPDLAVLDRAFQVLGENQEHTPYWRPLRPFKVTQQGLELLPQSVEIANSLMRICGARALITQAYFSRHLRLLERYVRWLLGRVFRGFASTKRTEDVKFVGWESDHTYTLDRIHLWQTSQVLIFLVHYTAMLQQHIARTGLHLAGLHSKVIGKEHTKDSRARVWPEWKVSEPLASASAGSRYRVYEQIEVDFVMPRALVAKTGKPSYSMLLYGPPGTGKSKIAEVLAEALGFPLLTVTPSDFITAGGEAVEARAKAIFQVLQEQTDLVVLFDEVDNLLLDRDSQFYREQGDIFKLLTPGMLTKLNGLARRRRVILIVATNYYERIDRAIKRPGRIDARYLVLPPDQAQRGAFLRTVVDGWDRIPGAKRKQIEQATVRFTYQELSDLWAYVLRRRSATQSEKLEQALLEAIEQVRPIITLGAYTTRLGMEGVAGEGKSETSGDTLERAWEEFALLAYLELEALGRLPDQPGWLPMALQKALDQRAIADPRIAEILRSALPGANAPLVKGRGK